MIAARDYVQLIREDTSFYWPSTRAEAEEFVERWKWDESPFRFAPYPTCWVCGELAASSEENRCHKHRGRTPCSIDGCRKSRKFEGYVSDERVWVCGIHWRQVCPPRSPLRRTYNRFFRIARKLGVAKERWPDELERRYWRFFGGMIARYHRGLVGYIDEREINKMFGWD